MEPIHPIFGIIILVFALIIIPMIINIGTDKKQEWADGLTGLSAFILAVASTYYVHEGKEIFVFLALMILYPMYVHLIFRYLIYVVLRFLIIKPIILLDSSMTAKIEQNKNAIKNSQNNQNNP